MNNIQNQYINSLLTYDQKTHYLAIDNRDQLVVRSKSDLGWASRFARCFWKPQTERISFVTQRIFTNTGRDISEKVNHDYSKLTTIFQNLRILAKKADKKLKQTTYSDLLDPMLCANFAKQGVGEKKAAIDKYTKDQTSAYQAQFKAARENQAAQLDQALADHEAQVEAVLDGCHKEVAKHKEEVANEIQAINQIRESRVSVNEKLDKTKTELGVKERLLAETTRKCEVLLKNSDQLENEVMIGLAKLNTIGKLNNEIENKIQFLTEKEKEREFNIVLWTDDGYVVCNTDLFDKDSPLLTATLKTMNKKLDMIDKKDSERNTALNSINRRFYLPEYQIKHVRMLMNLLEQKPDFIQKGTEKDLAAVKQLADYLLIKVDDHQLLDYVEQLARKEKLLAELKNQVTNLSDTMRDKNAEITQLNNVVFDFEDEVRNRNTEIGNLKQQLKKLQTNGNHSSYTNYYQPFGNIRDRY